MTVLMLPSLFLFFFFNDTATTEIYTLSLHDALPISLLQLLAVVVRGRVLDLRADLLHAAFDRLRAAAALDDRRVDRKSTRLNSSHSQISYAVFCLKKKKSIHWSLTTRVPSR